MNNKKIKEIAGKIIAIEKEVAMGESTKLCESKIFDLIKDLSFKEMIQIDEYIIKTKCLKK